MNRLLIIGLLLIAPLFSICAQDQDPEELYDDAEFFFAREDFEESAYLFRQLTKIEPANYNAQYMLGMSYLNIPGQEALAIPCFLKASESIDLKYKPRRYSEKNAPHHTWYYLGDAYAMTNQLDLALEAYSTFQSLKNFEKKYNIGVTEQRVKAVERAKIIQDAPLDLRASCLAEPINTAESDYAAVISANENVIVWIHSQRFYEAMMMTRKVDGKWSDPVNITPQVMSDGDLFPTGLSKNGDSLLMVKRGDLDSDIYFSTFDGNLWSVAEPVHGEINSNFTEDHASFSPDGQRIYVSSARRGSLGGLDIWYSDCLPDGTWGEPVNMGKAINTANDETSAFVSPDGSMFIFSSNGHFNMGGYDIFSSLMMKSGHWSGPMNMGYPINTTKDNLYFVPVKDGQSGLYTRYTDECIGKEDLWFIDIFSYEETVAGSLTRLSEYDFSITLDDQSGETIKLEYDAVNDKITVTSESGKTYRVIYSRDE